MNVLVGIPLTDREYKKEFRKQVLDVVKWNLEGFRFEIYETETESEGLEGVVEALNMIADRCLAGFDYAWIVEADVVPPPYAFEDLYHRNVDIALGCYPYHVKGHPSYQDLIMAGRFTDLNPRNITNFKRSEVVGRSFKNMVWAGIGCSLISRNVFSSGLRFELRDDVGHDLWFLYRAQKEEFEVVLDGGVICEHLP